VVAERHKRKGVNPMQATMKGNVVTITVNLEPPRPSKTGRTNIRYSSAGFQAIPGGNGLKANVTIIESK
jgi:hypothetical protein